MSWQKVKSKFEELETVFNDMVSESVSNENTTGTEGNAAGREASELSDALAGNCPDCGKEITIEETPEFNERKPFERYCEWCGWFDERRYVTKADAQLAS